MAFDEYWCKCEKCCGTRAGYRTVPLKLSSIWSGASRRTQGRIIEAERVAADESRARY
jgi:hypothetical protein